ncbi:cadherin domain-containing protein [Pseudidiomarina halophila]|uniref:cadherin domain-containing protein n=1 Tax=Pseudidiomarina halophila TaxID=1449799 RepID=UPI00361E4C58
MSGGKGSITFSLEGEDADAFNVDPSTGEVTFKASPDYEMKTSYNITLVGKDNSGTSVSQDIVINIIDVPETVVQGKVAAGLVYDGVTVTLYDADGAVLGTSDVDSNGHYEIVLASDYTGTVLAVATDVNDGEVNYNSEVTGLSYTMTGDLRAAHVIDVAAGATVTLNITPATELAALIMGAGTTTPTADAGTINGVNVAVGTRLGVLGDHNVVTSDVVTVDQSDFSSASDVAQSYGQALAILAGAENVERTGGSQDPVGDSLGVLAAGLSYDSGSGDVSYTDNSSGVAAETLFKDGAAEFDSEAPDGTPFKGSAEQSVVDNGTLTAPTLVSVERGTTSGVGSDGLTAVDSVAYTVTFSEALGATPAVSDFIASLAGASVSAVAPVSGSENVFTVTIDLTSATQDGALSLGIAGGSTIVDKVGLSLASTTPSGSNETYIVDRINEAPAFAQASETASFEENATGVVYTASATDPDPLAANSSLTYSLGGTDAAAFSIDGATGEISFVASPDYEAQDLCNHCDGK